MMAAEPAFLLKDVQGEKSLGKIQGLWRSNSKTVYRGELLLTIPRVKVIARKDGKPPHNYQLASDPAVTLFCTEDDVAPISDYEYHLLTGVKSREARYEIFQKDILDWGTKLKEGDFVYVATPSKSLAPNQWAVSVIKFIGPLPNEHGMQFGVEILEEQYRYQGSSNGHFGGEQYFECEENCALFVSLDRLLPMELTTPSQSKAQKSNSDKQSLTQPPQSCFKMNDRVVVYNKYGVGIHGTVKLIKEATYAGDKLIAIGIETDVAVQSKEFEGSLIGFTQHFKCTDAKHGKLAMPESMVTSEREDAAQHLKQKRNISNGGISVDAHAHEHPHEDVPAEDKFLKAALPTGHWHADFNLLPYQQQPSPPGPISTQRELQKVREPKSDQSSINKKVVTGTQTETGLTPTLVEGSRVQIPCSSLGEPFKYGVIRWIGDMPAVQGLVAGIELDLHMEGGTDGTLASTGQKFFSCQPGKGIFYPFYSLQPDEGSSNYYLRRWQEAESSSKYENDQLKRQLSIVQQDNMSLLSSQQESIAFGIEPWKVPREAVMLEGVIGGGGWGSVHKGRLQVAVKQFYPNILSEQNIARLKREMRMLALIRHPNLLQFIAAVFDENEDHRRRPPYIITELLDMSLRSAYEDVKLPSHSLLSIFIDTARALDYLHRRHEPIIHRDVSSANVLLKQQPNEKWITKLSDLGSANLAREAYTMNEGARVYCAPEAFTLDDDARSQATLTPKVDVYSYGVMLCEVATSTFPYKAQFSSMFARVRREWPQLHPLIVACTNQSPEQRPTMESVLDSLKTFPGPI